MSIRVGGNVIGGNIGTDLLATKTDLNLSNSTAITNCITQIPQDIKLELNNGTLTLKAGSKVYVPNGRGVFDEKTISSDISIANLTYNTKYLLFTDTNAIFLFAEYVTDCSSGTTQPSGIWKTWYDTTNNRVKRFGNTEGTVLYEGSLPIAIITVSGGAISSIDQVFNGFGYIGSTVFALSGVKGLIPNGRNADGSLKNIELVLDRVSVRTDTTGTNRYAFALQSSKSFTRADYFTLSDDNYLYNNSNKKFTGFEVIEATQNNGVITSFTPKTAFHAVDRNDSSWLSGLGMPSSRYIDLTLGANGATYTAPANGWFFIRKRATAVGQFIQAQTSGYRQVYKKAYGNGDIISVNIPILKGYSLYVGYDLGGSTDYFRFIYAEGESNV